MNAALVLTDGRRVVAPMPLVGDGAAYDLALDVLPVPRHEARFEGVELAGDVVHVVFRVSKDLALAWTRAPTPVVSDPRAEILACARVLGFPLAGVTAPSLPSRYVDRFSEWIDRGAHASMDFLARKADARRAPAFPGARSVIALATPYSPVDRSDRSARIARYAQSRDYHEVIDKRLHALEAFVARRFGARCFLSVDTGAVLERAFAEQAGIGWIGKNGVLMSRTHGSYLFLATLWTSLDLAFDAPHDEHCGSCVACMDGCPTQAIVEPGFVDARRCIAYWTIEHEGPIEERTHGWLFGCDVCQEVCPWNRFAVAPVMRELREPRVFRWTDASDAEIEAEIAGTPLRRCGAKGLRRNALKIVE